MIKVLFKLVKLWFKLAGLLAGLLAGVFGALLAVEFLTRAGEITARQEGGQPPTKTRASSPARRRDHGARP